MSGFPSECLTGAGDAIQWSSAFLECVRNEEKGREMMRKREREREKLTERE